MFTDLARMDSQKVVCSCICFCFLLITMITAMPNMDKQVAPLKCLNIGRTKYKLCIEDNEQYHGTDTAWDSQKHKKHLDNIFTTQATFNPTPLYNQRLFTDYGGMIVPFYMKRRSRQQSDVPFQRLFSFMAHNMDGLSQRVNKRPFDSISYSSGLGGFN